MSIAFNSLDYSEKIVLVTGAGVGIGRFMQRMLTVEWEEVRAVSVKDAVRAGRDSRS